jgi:hypothetical protein
MDLGGRQAVSKETIPKTVTDTERVKNTAIHACAKTVSACRPSTGSRRLSSFHNFTSFNHYFRKYCALNLCIEKYVVMV